MAVVSHGGVYWGLKLRCRAISTIFWLSELLRWIPRTLHCNRGQCTSIILILYPLLSAAWGRACGHVGAAVVTGRGGDMDWRDGGLWVTEWAGESPSPHHHHNVITHSWPAPPHWLRGRLKTMSSWCRHWYITGGRAVCEREEGVSAGPGRSSAAQFCTLPRRTSIVTCFHCDSIFSS